MMDILRKYNLDIVMLEETKKIEISRQCLASVWGIRNLEWISSPAEGTAGGMLIGWKKELFDLNQIEQGFFSLSLIIRNKQEDFQWWLSCICGPSVYQHKNDLGWAK